MMDADAIHHDPLHSFLLSVGVLCDKFNNALFLQVNVGYVAAIPKMLLSVVCTRITYFSEGSFNFYCIDCFDDCNLKLKLSIRFLPFSWSVECWSSKEARENPSKGINERVVNYFLLCFPI